MCVGKGLTGGYLPLAATLTSERIYEGFLGRPEELRTFFHGHTFTGNPLGCAAGIATLQTFELEQTVQRSLAKIELLTRRLDERIASLPGVAEIRQCGLMVGIELHPGDALGNRVTLAARRRGAVIRPLGDVIVLMPAPAMSSGEIDRLVAITAAAIAEVTADEAADAGCSRAAVA
jgi:adenosylmethionine-8-amino-7-oxononanoate aminotransferase